MNLMRRSVSIAALAVALLLGGGREAAAYGGFATFRNPCTFSPFGPYYRCNVFECLCSAMTARRFYARLPGRMCDAPLMVSADVRQIDPSTPDHREVRGEHRVRALANGTICAECIISG